MPARDFAATAMNGRENMLRSLGPQEILNASANTSKDMISSYYQPDEYPSNIQGLYHYGDLHAVRGSSVGGSFEKGGEVLDEV